MNSPRKPTVGAVARAAGVSLSTVNRLLHGTGTVRPETVDRILAAADEVGYYGIKALQRRKQENLPHRRLGFLMQQSHRAINQIWAKAISDACDRRHDAVIDAHVIFEDDLSPDAVVSNLLEIGKNADAVAVVTADHPLVSNAINELRNCGVPVVTFVTDLSAAGRAGYVGTDNWKVGRTAAWFVSETSHGAGKVAQLIGSNRYQCQDFADASFRSYLREHAPQFQVLNSLLTGEEPETAYRLARQLLAEETDLRGIFVNGGGISGVLRAMRELNPSQTRRVRVVCRDIGPETRKGLSERLITAALCLPVHTAPFELVGMMLDLIDRPSRDAVEQCVVPFDVVTPESVWS